MEASTAEQSADTSGNGRNVGRIEEIQGVVIVEMEKPETSGAKADVFAKLLGTAEAVPSQDAFLRRASSLKGFPRQAFEHTKRKKEKATAPPIENRRKTHLSEP